MRFLTHGDKTNRSLLLIHGIGDLVACEHCRNAVSEMEQIDIFYEKLMEGYPKDKLKVWNRLRSMMPTWDELHERYGN